MKLKYTIEKKKTLKMHLITIQIVISFPLSQVKDIRVSSYKCMYLITSNNIIKLVGKSCKKEESIYEEEMCQ